jgi:hypothetical protein
MDLDVSATRDALADMLSQRDQWLPHLERSDDHSALEDNLLEAVEQDLIKLLAVMPERWAAQLAPLAHFAAGNLLQTKADSPIVALLDWDGSPFEASVDELERWRGLAALLLTGEGQVR